MDDDRGISANAKSRNTPSPVKPSLKVVTMVGARPQFIKAAPVSLALRSAGIDECLVHTGQHYDTMMSDIFFQRLHIPAPHYNLGVGSASHGIQTGRIMAGMDPILEKEHPRLVIVYGDTNSTLAGALSAVKLHIPVAHIEAGLRSFNRRMPEEINRVVTDHVASLLFVPSDAAIRNLNSEGIVSGIHRTGDVMFDTTVMFQREVGILAADVPGRFGVEKGKFALITIHRAENTDDPDRWFLMIQAISALPSQGIPVIWPIHPRIRARLVNSDLKGVTLLEPLPYFETQALLMNARVVLTDSGGLQKEAAFHRVPCVTARTETEWVELVDAGVNRLAGNSLESILDATLTARWPESGLPSNLYGNGRTAETIAREIQTFLASS
jgi:UDP-GlcNAc3NAcA epimerase